MSWDRHVLPHSDIMEILPGLWQVTGRLPRGNLSRNMVLYRLPTSGGLLIHSGIALDEPTVRQMEGLGRPEVLIVPNRFHRLDAPVYKERYPQLRVLAPENALAPVAKKIPVDETCERALPLLGVRAHAPDGIRPGELCYELPVKDGHALVVADLLFNLPHRPGVDGLLFRLLGSTGFFGMTKIGRLFMLQDRHLFRNWLKKMATRADLQAICVGHGQAITVNVQQCLLAASDRI